jgi:hypothetical protein
MAAGRPASATAEAARVFLSANENFSADSLLLEMALQTQDMIAFDQHPWIDGSMRLVASGATLADGFVFEDERTALRDVAFAAGLLLRAQGGAAANDRLALVRIVAIGATNSRSARNGPGMRSVQNRMRVGQAELGTLIQVTLKTGFGRTARIDNGAVRAAGLVMQAGGSMTGFTTHVFGMVTRGLHARVGSGGKTLHDLLMALSTGFRTGEGSAGHCRWLEQSSVRGAGEQSDGDGDGGDCEQGCFPTRGRPGIHFGGRLVAMIRFHSTSCIVPAEAGLGDEEWLVR